jgi:hypothetical protein
VDDGMRESKADVRDFGRTDDSKTCILLNRSVICSIAVREVVGRPEQCLQKKLDLSLEWLHFVARYSVLTVTSTCFCKYKEGANIADREIRMIESLKNNVIRSVADGFALQLQKLQWMQMLRKAFLGLVRCVTFVICAGALLLLLRDFHRILIERIEKNMFLGVNV